MTLNDSLTLMTTNPRPYATAEVLAMASRHGLQNAVRRGEVVRLLPGLYAAAIHAESWLVRARAALEWAPDAALSGASAVFACGALIDAPTRVEIAVPRNGRRRYPPWIAARRTDVPIPTAWWDPDGDGTEWWRDEYRTQALRIVEPAFAVALGYGAQSPTARADLVYGPVRSGLATPGEIGAALRVLPRVRDRKGLLRRLAFASVGIESYLEEVGARRVLAGPNFAGLLRQHRLRTGGAVFRADAYHAASMTCFEFDGARFHEPRRLEDSRRDALLASEGILTVRFGYADAVNRPQWCRDLALRVVRSRVPHDPLLRR